MCQEKLISYQQSDGSQPPLHIEITWRTLKILAPGYYFNWSWMQPENGIFKFPR